MAASYGRDPREMLERYRRETKEGGLDYWATGAASTLADFAASKTRIDAILFGDCDIQMEADFLRREAARRGIDLRVAATFPDDAALRRRAQARRDPHRRAALAAPDRRAPRRTGRSPPTAYIAEARHLIEGLRAQTAAPILIDNLPEPTVQPLGMAERGAARPPQPLPRWPTWTWPSWPRTSPTSTSSTSPRRWRRRAPSACSTTAWWASPISARRAGCCSGRKARRRPCTASSPTRRRWPPRSAAIPMGARR